MEFPYPRDPRRLATVAAERALAERQQVVVPVAVRIRAQVRCAASRPDDSHIGPFAVVWVKNVKRIGLGVDTRNDLLPGPTPCRRITQVCDVLMLA